MARPSRASAPVRAAHPRSFNVDGFLREAKKSFIALQAANDRGDASIIRDFVTDEMFTAPETGHRRARRGGASRPTSSRSTPSLLELVTEGRLHLASVRFSGMLREDTGAAPQPFEEIWNLQKSAQGDSGWLLAGIQQTS